MKEINDKYSLTFKETASKQEKTKYIEDIFEYIIRQEKNKEYLVLTTRRWDMFILLSSTRWAIGIGLLVGLICRIYSQFLLFQWSSSSESVRFNAEVSSLILLSVAMVILFIVISKGIHNLLTEYFPLLKAIIRNPDVGSALKIAIMNSAGPESSSPT